MLVGEDHADTRAMLQALFTTYGFDVAECADGPEALAAAIRLEPDVVLLDACLADLDGFAVTQEIRRSPGVAHVPIVMVSGYSKSDAQQRAEAAGCDHFMLKPVDIQALLGLVCRLTLDAKT